jgi:hypothetical protein
MQPTAMHQRGPGTGQQVATLALVAAFCGLAALSPRHSMTLFASGFVAFALTFGLARRLGQTSRAGLEMLPVVLSSFLIFCMPPSLSPPLRGTTMPAMLVGVVAAQALWAIHRYPPLPAGPSAGFWRNTLVGAGVGLLGGVGLIGLAAAILAYQKTRNGMALPSEAWNLLKLGYVLGGTVGGAMAGALRPLWRWPLGTMFAGSVGGFALYAAVGPAASYPEITPLSEHLGIAAACGLLVGPGVAISWRYSDPIAV